ncbi:CubicO group peptidase, beta-lactamase class C family [Flaviramulus basaltis]|uniref:CubicO group peptidase, beta-lactamase class C family n=1 Tax=Flaviramulus basaltis TaxID=369401 RepID=A0A1K2ILB9_9FLAO|nr:serine hydrolase domain-containing protein [Flaviramulus basaltis]SFZ93008.1 CubicO group peptidase, beta-lactamase class C family [Flaviramulus basaltis]
MKPKIHLSLIALFIAFTLYNCSSSNDPIEKPEEENPTPETLYFPPIGSDDWETYSLTELNWNEAALQPLLNLVEEKGSKAFIILKNGKIVVEWYSEDFSATENHTWNSAAKTLTAYTMGIAQKEGYLNIYDSSQDYLGANWSSMTDQQEKNITIWNHLTMTTGMDYNVENNSCTEPSDLLYKNEPSTYWYYHNASYRLNLDIITGATGIPFTDYFNEKLKNKIGMQGVWIPLGCFNLFYSTARSMARFGLLNLNNGIWDNTTILSDTEYLNAMTNTSQNLNKAYGYLWWLNGKDSFKLPQYEDDFSGKLIPDAPDDLIAGLGKSDQKVYVVTSKKLVVVRMGDDSGDTTFGPSSFDNELWIKINALTN